MHVVIFEVWPSADCSDRYFEIAESLRAELENIDGFISVERFESRTEPGKYLSLSFWRDQKAIEDWYSDVGHSDAQAEGRSRIFRNYRIRVGEIHRDYDLADGRPKLPS